MEFLLFLSPTIVKEIKQKHNTMKKHFSLSLTLLLILSLGGVSQILAFCGFYVAKADAKLFNKSSQVIIARQDGQTVITMSNDFQGDMKDFAMVVPVPEVIKKNQIRIAKQEIFDKLDAYSGPRLVEYHDSNPCQVKKPRPTAGGIRLLKSASAPGMDMAFKEKAERYQVTIEETYTVGEYDILVLSAKESNGLKRWLIDNDYKIPQDAEEVLEPYIKSELKFFVVKVNLDELEKSGSQTLRPIQMSFRSDNFMLPIRLGMANANGDQDLIVYAFTENGRIETANYRTVRIPTDTEIPTFTKSVFGRFYKDVFEQAWEKAGKNISMMEYGWDLSSSNFVKCDPCPTQPPAYADLREAGIFWVTQNGGSYAGNLYITRLHVRYNRKTFPQDLTFIETPDKARFQGRYIMRHPAKGSLNCSQGQNYLKTLVNRRQKELQNLNALAGWDISPYNDYVDEYAKKLKKKDRPGDGYLDRLPKKDDTDKGGFFFALPDFPTGGGGGHALPWVFTIGLLVLLITLTQSQLRNRFRTYP